MPTNNGYNLIDGTSKNDKLKGSSGADKINGGGGDDVIAGMGGQDQIEGGGGFDTVDYSWSPQGVRVNLDNGANVGNATWQNLYIDSGGYLWNLFRAISGVIGTNYADRINGHNGVNTLNGGNGDDFLDGFAGNDRLIGGNGADMLFGGLGDDVMTGDAGDDSLDGGGDKDSLDGGAGNDRIIGSWGNDALSGGAGDDFLVGGAGVDHLNGGDGFDTISYQDAARAVVLDLRTGNGAANTNDAAGDNFTSIERFDLSWQADTFYASSAGALAYGMHGQDTLNGGAGDDRLFGDGDGVAIVSVSENDDVLNGNGGNDILTGGVGRDKINGGAGYDIAGYSDATAGVTIDLRTPTGTANKGDARGDVFTDIEGFDLSSFDDVFFGGAFAITIHGFGGKDTLNGGSANDSLFGDDGNDILNGLGGDDTIEGGLGADQIDGGAGIDTVTYLTAGADVGIDLRNTTGQANRGDALGDTFFNVERFILSAKNDTFVAGVGSTDVRGWDGNDQLTGGGGSDRLAGDAGNDVLRGGDGNDVLIGGLGSDWMDGGAGADLFPFYSIDDSRAGSADRIASFSAGDVIDLSAIDANTKQAGDQPFVLMPSFTRKPGQAVVSYSNGVTTISLDVNGDKIPDFVLQVDGRPDLNAGWIHL